MAESPMRVARILWGSAALMVALGLFLWSGIIDLGIEPWRLALLCAVVAVADIAMSAFILTRRRS